MGLFAQLKNLFRPETPAESAATPIIESVPGSAAPAPLAVAVERRQRPRLDARQGTRVLIIDDSKTITTVLRKFLRSAGYDTLEAFDAESALAQLKDYRPELIFLDIVLPGINGFAALRAIRRDPQTRDIPVIMMSGNEQAMEQFFGTRIGADDFMKKPFSRYEVFFRIERLLDENLTPRRAQRSPEAPPLAVAQSA